MLCVDQSCTSSAPASGYEFPPGTTTASAAPLKAVPTFNNIGLYWTEPTGAPSNEALVRFRQVGTGTWRQGLSLWFDNRTAARIPYGSEEYRGSLVELNPNTTYEVEVLTAGSRRIASTQVTTWSEDFPVGSTVTLPVNSSSTLNITQSGTSSGYRLYSAAAGQSAMIDGANRIDNAVVISASYVIVRGLTLKNVRKYGIALAPTAHHVVIEDNDISNFGRADPQMPQFSCNGSAGISTLDNSNLNMTHVVIQNNAIHHPNFDSNSWTEPRQASSDCASSISHPQGSAATYLKDTGGRIVIRYNHVYSDMTHMFDDGFSGGQNFSHNGDLRRDSDIYGNIVSYAWDDLIQTEGAGMNVRIYNNYTERGLVAIANAPVSIGPVYVFRNVATRGIRDPALGGAGGEGHFWKTRNKSADGTVAGITVGGGRVYLFHNTVYRVGSGDGIRQMLSIDDVSLVNIVSRNNVWNANSQISASRVPMPDSDFDNDLVSSGHTNYLIEERRGKAANPSYDSGHSSGKYALKLGTPGFDDGILIPNFNDRYSGSAPDTGAQEAGWSALRFGRRND
jgi:hypothetical protein